MKSGVKPVVAANFVRDAGSVLDHRELEHRLRVVCHRAVGIDGDRHRPHPEEPERNEAECKHRRGDHQRVEPHPADQVRDAHQADDVRPASTR